MGNETNEHEPVTISASSSSRRRRYFGSSSSSNNIKWIVVFAVLMFLVFRSVAPDLKQFGFDDRKLLLDTFPVSSRSSALAIPQGNAVALPSIRIDEMENTKVQRSIYGGNGDKVHLGGFTDIDLHGISPSTWKDMISYFGVKSLMDVGCGRGISTTWFLTHGVDALCVEGSHDARERTMLPDPEHQMVEHDFSRGPWWPYDKTYDAVWCVEFLEHVGRNFHPNYLPTFRKSALLFVTHSTWGGWHHVEVHDDDWWIHKFESYGFRYSERLTKRIRQVAHDEAGRKETAPNGKEYNAQHIWLNMQVYINPEVAALPDHVHLFSEPGCYADRGEGDQKHRPCTIENKETPLPDNYSALKLSPEMDQTWEDIVRKNIPKPKEEEKEQPKQQQI